MINASNRIQLTALVWVTLTISVLGFSDLYLGYDLFDFSNGTFLKLTLAALVFPISAAVVAYPRDAISAISLFVLTFVALDTAGSYFLLIQLGDVIDEPGIIGASMLTVTLALLRPFNVAKNLATYFSRTCWGLSVAPYFLLLLCLGAVLTSEVGDPRFALLIAFNLCGYFFCLSIYFLLLLAAAVKSKCNKWFEMHRGYTFQICAAGLLNLPLYTMVLPIVYSEESRASLISDLSQVPMPFSPNFSGTFVATIIIIILGFAITLLNRFSISSFPIKKFSELGFVLLTLAHQLQYISFLGSHTDPSSFLETGFSISAGFGIVFFAALLLAKSSAIQRLKFEKNFFYRLSAAAITSYLTYKALSEYAPDTAMLMALIAMMVFIAFLAHLVSLENQILARTAEVRAERAKADALLENILPRYVIQDLKDRGTSEPRELENISVMFTDFVGFTKIAQSMSAKELIAELNEIFTAFDHVVDKHFSERIKTIGDAYMCVSGLTSSPHSSARNLVGVGEEMLAFLHARNMNSEVQWKIRIGIASGKCMGGIVGEKKYLFDLFGDAVNTASRMESNSEAGRIHIDQNTHLMLKAEQELSFEKRPMLQVKGKGEMQMYFVGGT